MRGIHGAVTSPDTSRGTNVSAGAADDRVPPLAGELPPHCRRDLATLRKFIHSAVSRGSPAEAASPAEFREVLLTGATGSVGRFFLRDLLRQKSDLVVHCLVRAGDAEQGHARIRAALREAGIWDDSLAPRIRAVAGDISRVRFGLSEDAFDALRRSIDAVYHLAASLNLASSYLAIRKVNTLSIQNMLDLCLGGRFKHLFYTSTMGVFPEYFCGFVREFAHGRIDHQMQPDLASMARMFPIGFLGYPWSKLTTEQSLLFAQSTGMPLAIFRLPQSALSGTGYTPTDHFSVRFFSALLDCGAMPEGVTLARHNEPLDTLSRVCTAISLNPGRRFTIFHCCNPRPVNHDIEPAEVGLDLREVSYETFRRMCQARGTKSPLHGQWALIDHFAKYWIGNPGARDAVPVCDRAIREDCPHPITWPGMMTMYTQADRWVRRRRRQWPYPVAQVRLDGDRLLVQAERHAEREGVPFGEACPEWMRRGLRHLVQALAAPEARLLEDELGMIVSELSRNLRNNAALVAERRRHPEIERAEIRRPVFIVGINRTGTTFLHRLLARDRRFWTLRGYELGEPTLPAEQYATTAWTPADPRRARAADILEATGVRRIFAGIHHVDIDEPEEDFPILRLAFANWVTLVRYHVPEYGRWLAATGSGDAYAWHRRTMQHFTWQRRQREPGCARQWLFKMPGHLMELENVIGAYPDAVFIQTHREPARFMGSWMSMVERIRSLSSEPRPRRDLGVEQLAFMSDMLDRAVRFREAHPELEHRWFDVSYVDLIENPMAIVRGIHERFDWHPEQAAMEAMEDWRLRQAERRRRETRHRYDLKDYDLTPEAVDAAFARYREFVTTRGLRDSRL